MLGADGGVVEPGADAVGELDLAVVVGKEPGLGPLENTEFAALETGGTNSLKRSRGFSRSIPDPSSMWRKG